MVMSDSPPTLQSSLSSSSTAPEYYAPHTYVTASSENPLLTFPTTRFKVDPFRHDVDKNKDSEMLVLQRSLEAEQHQTNLLRGTLESEKKRSKDLVDQLAVLKQEVVNIRLTNAQVLHDQDMYMSKVEEAIRSENTYLKEALAAAEDEAQLQTAEIERLKHENRDLKDKLSEARIAAADADVERTTRQMENPRTASPAPTTQASYVEVPKVEQELEAPRSAKKRIDFGHEHQDSPGTLFCRRVATEDAVRRAVPFGSTTTPNVPASAQNVVSGVTPRTQAVPLELYDKARAQALRPPMLATVESNTISNQKTVLAASGRQQAGVAVSDKELLSTTMDKPDAASTDAQATMGEPSVNPIITTLPPGVSPALHRSVARTGHPLVPASTGPNAGTKGTSAVFRVPTLDFTKLRTGTGGPVLAGSQTERAAWVSGKWEPMKSTSSLESESPLNSARSLPSYPPLAGPRHTLLASRFNVLRERGGYPRAVEELEAFV